MGRPIKHQDRKAVTVYLSEAEYKWVELQADGNLSDWCREKVLAGKQTEELQDALVAEHRRNHPEFEPAFEAAGEMAKNVAKDIRNLLKTCVHGRARGYNCWQCGGLAKVAG